MTTWDIITGPDPWPHRYTFSPAVRAGNLLFISGTTASDKDGRIVAPGDIIGQTRYIFQNFEALLNAAGAGFEHIVQTTDYITSTANYSRTAEVRREFFRGPVSDRHRRDRQELAARRGADRNLGSRGSRCTARLVIEQRPLQPREGCVSDESA